MNVLFLVAAAVGLVVQAAHCPSGCSCRDTDVLTCTGPAPDLPPNTGSLSIRPASDSSKPLDLQPVLDTLRQASLTKLIRLDLANCSIHTLVNISFNALDTLRSLDLSHNVITQLPADTDTPETFNLTALLVLDLSNNFIQEIYGSPFRTLHSLHLLNLSANAIDKILVEAFYGLALLQNLDISANNLTQLPDGVFASLVSLQHLNLSGNKLRTLADGCFGSLLRLQQLDVSWNQLCHVAPSTLQSLPSLSRLLLADNPNLGDGSKEAALLVGTGRRLQTVDASRTGLKHVPATLTHSVRTLRLAGNTIRVVRCGDLDSYPLLQLLDLTTNELEEIEEDALGRLELLTVLYLTDNKLRAIPRSLPDRLEILHLEFNHIEQIVSGDLLGMPKLEVLLLNDNAIKVVQEGAFSQVTSLVTLDLSRNPISILPGDTLAGPARLQMLRLSELTVDPPAEDMAFPVPAPEHLVRLDLSGSAGLARQLLADTAALAAFRELQELNLANTDLINIRSDLLHYLPQMHDFHLTGNRLNCSGLLWLALWMRRQDQPEYRRVTCVYPAELYGTLVVDLQDTDVQEITSTTLMTSTTTTTTTTNIEFKTESTEQMEKDTTLIEVTTTIYPGWSKVNTFNNINLEEQVNRSTVRGLQNMVKSLVEKKEKVKEEYVNVSDRRMVENTGRAGDEHRSSTVAVGDQLHLFPIATTEIGWRGSPIDKTEAEPVTDGHIDEINPSDNRVATEPSNYKSNALPRGHNTMQTEAESVPIPVTVTAISRDEWTTSKVPARDALRDVRQYANEAENLFGNRARDNVTKSAEILSNVFMGQVPVAAAAASRQLVHTPAESVIEAAPAKSAVAPAAMVNVDTDVNVDVAGTVGVTSMYAAGANTGHNHWGSGVRPSPALFALLAAALGAGAALCSLISHVRRRRRRGSVNLNGYDRHQDIEVNTLGSMHELW